MKYIAEARASDSFIGATKPGIVFHKFLSSNQLVPSRPVFDRLRHVLASGILIALSLGVEEKAMKCYFSAKSEPKEKSKNDRVLISFAIPDLGVLFRTHYKGELDECSYMSLLKLLKFIESNPKAFQNQKIQILSHDPRIIYQVNQRESCGELLEKLHGLALLYKERLKYSLNWIPLQQNRAEKGLLDQPPIKNQIPLNFGELDTSVEKKSGERSSSKPTRPNG